MTAAVEWDDLARHAEAIPQRGGSPMNTPASFWERVDRASRADECWLWTGTVDRRGYGRLRYRGRFAKAHRLAYELTHGSIPEGMFVLHSCDEPGCCNPAHLRAGDHAENMRDRARRGRSRNARTTHCPSGHEYTPENTRITTEGFRRCRQCARRQDAERRARLRAVLSATPTDTTKET